MPQRSPAQTREWDRSTKARSPTWSSLMAICSKTLRRSVTCSLTDGCWSSKTHRQHRAAVDGGVGDSEEMEKGRWKMEKRRTRGISADPTLFPLPIDRLSCGRPRVPSRRVLLDSL